MSGQRFIAVVFDLGDEAVDGAFVGMRASVMARTIAEGYNYAASTIDLPGSPRGIEAGRAEWRPRLDAS